MHGARDLVAEALAISTSGIEQSVRKLRHSGPKICQTAQEAIRVIILDNDTGGM